MKTSLLLNIAIVLSFISCNNGQNKAPNNTETETRLLNPKFDEHKIHGIGVFKIGATIESTIAELVNNQRYVLDTISNIVDQRNANKINRTGITVAFRILPTANTLESDVDMLKHDYTIGLWCKKTSIFNIAKYVVDSIETEDLVLKYYDNKLVYIEGNASDELVSAMQTKYGKYDIATEGGSANGYRNGDIEARITEEVDVALVVKKIRIFVTGVRPFLISCGEHDFAIQDSINKDNKHQGLKNL